MDNNQDHPPLLQDVYPEPSIPPLWAYRLAQLEKSNQKLEEKLEEFEKEYKQRERKNLIAGIMLLGSIVTTLGTVIWSNRGAIFGGHG